MQRAGNRPAHGRRERAFFWLATQNLNSCASPPRRSLHHSIAPSLVPSGLAPLAVPCWCVLFALLFWSGLVWSGLVLAPAGLPLWEDLWARLKVGLRSVGSSVVRDPDGPAWRLR